jgi:hypothetical protein
MELQWQRAEFVSGRGSKRCLEALGPVDECFSTKQGQTDALYYGTSVVCLFRCKQVDCW